MYLKTAVRARLFSKVHSNRTRDNGHESQHGKFELDTRKKKCDDGRCDDGQILEYGIHGGYTISILGDVKKTHLSTALSNLTHVVPARDLDQMTFRGPFQS